MTPFEVLADVELRDDPTPAPGLDRRVVEQYVEGDDEATR